MNKFFADVVADAKWIGKKIASAATWVPKLIKISDDVEADAPVVIPELVTVIDGVEALGVAAIKDGGAFLSDFGVLTAAVAQAVAARGANFGEDAAVLAAAEALIQKLGTVSSYADVVGAVKQLVVSYDALGATVKAELLQLEADATS